MDQIGDQKQQNGSQNNFSENQDQNNIGHKSKSQSDKVTEEQNRNK
jgi:hypothetical protein